jgi:hypothetical protein
LMGVAADVAPAVSRLLGVSGISVGEGVLCLGVAGTACAAERNRKVA